MFARFDIEPLAAASIAQVHHAQQKGGTEVIVKTRRPGITEIIEADLRLLGKLALLIKAFIPLEGMGRGLDPGFHMATEAMPLLRQLASERLRPRAMAARGWKTLRRALSLAEKLPHDFSRLLRNARNGHLSVGIGTPSTQRSSWFISSCRRQCCRPDR